MPQTAFPNLSARQLQAVLALAENRSFIAAAAALNISQPALTRTLKQVEAALGVELFSRTTRQVSATSAGKEFIALAERLLHDLKIGIDSLREQTGRHRGQVIVASVLQLSNANFPQVLAEYRQQHGGIDIHLREGMQGNVIDDVRSGVADFGIAYVNALPANFSVESLGVESLHVVFPTGHAFAKAKKLEIAQLKEAALISYPTEARTRRLVDGMAAAAGFAPRHIVTVNRVSTLMNLVRRGVGIAVVPSSERPTRTDGVVTSRPLSRAKVSRLGIVRLRDRELSLAATDLLSTVKVWVRKAAPRRLHAARR